MRKFVFFLPVLGVLALGFVFYTQIGKNPEYMPSALIGKPVPAVRLVSLQTDKELSNTDFPKGPYLINFWATWCPTCALEHPYLMTLAKQGVPIVGVDYKDDQTKAKEWLRSKGDPYEMILMDELGNFAINMGVTGAPETFVVNRKGMIVFRYQGALDSVSWQKIRRYMK